MEHILSAYFLVSFCYLVSNFLLKFNDKKECKIQYSIMGNSLSFLVTHTSAVPHDNSKFKQVFIKYS